MTIDTLLPSDGLIRRGDRRRHSTLISRNVTVDGHRTSVRLEPAMWDALAYVCKAEGKSVHRLVTQIAQRHDESSLTAAIRVFLMRYFRAAAAATMMGQVPEPH
jgi:predicted DNA-binding ribbon-helix-helix protein